MRKRSISLIVVLTFLLSLFPMALPAFAADYTRVGSIISVSDDDTVQLNRVKMEFSNGELKPGHSVILRLPSGFEFRDGDPGSPMTQLQWDSAWGASTGNAITVAKDSTGTSVTGNVYKLDDNEIKIEIATIGAGDIELFVELENIYVDDGFEGDIPLKFKAPSGSGFDSGEVIVGRVGEGDVTVEVMDTETFSDDGGDVVIRLEEDRAGAFEDKTESVKFILPDGFEWGAVSNFKTIFGDAIFSASDFDPDGDELIFDATAGPTGKATCIEFKARINVEDETDAELGDIIAKVKGESDVTPATIVVGTYGDYQVEVTAEDPETVYAGQTEQAIADITLEELIEGSLIDGRSVTLTLPSWAKWGFLPDEVDDGTVELNLTSFPGKDGRTAKYSIKNNMTSPDAGELTLEDMEVVLSPEAPEGDLEVEVGGTAAVDAKVKVAEVKKPIIMETTQSPTIVIGRSAQSIAEITLTEAEAGLIREGTAGDLILELPKDVEWEDFEVEVVEGDLEIGDVDADDELLFIEIEDESNDPSKIKITGTIVAYRTVPEGSVTAEVWGLPVIAVHDEDALEDQYAAGNDGKYWLIEGVDSADSSVDLQAAEADDISSFTFDHDGSDSTPDVTIFRGILFGDDGPIAEDEVAFVGTPAPSEQQIKAVFTLGSTTFTLNGVEQTMDVAPYAKNGRTYLPMRYVAKALGIKDSGILWKAGTATFISGNKVVSVKVGSSVMTINGAPVSMDVAPEIVSGRVMIPIKWIATAFDVDVAWDAATQTVTVE